MATKINKNLKTFITHGGVFHADEVFCTALLEIYLGRKISANVKRVFSLDTVFPDSFTPIDEETLIYDIGGGKYDHHQQNAEVRENGVPYAAFGLLWREIGPELVGQEEADIFDKVFVQPIDHTDNTGESNPLSMTISTFNPDWNENDGPEYFSEAVKFAKNILVNHIRSIKAKLNAKEIAEKYISEAKDGIATFDQFVPAVKLLSESDCIYHVYPSKRGAWNLQTVNQPGLYKPVAKKPLPKKWLNLDEAPDGMSFCHKGLFVAAFNTKEQAIAAAYLAKDEE